MALSRWSHSDHYIYEPVGYERTLHVQFLGNFTIEEILKWEPVEKAIVERDYSSGFLSDLELKIYLTDWAKMVSGKMARSRYLDRLQTLRLYGIIKRYIEDPWSVNFERMQMFYFPKWLGGTFW